MPITITPAQALLILISHHQGNEELSTKLKKLYLMGVQNQSDLSALNEFFESPVLEAYNIVQDKEAINNDPTRRYFETHLSLETVRQGISDIDTSMLETFTTEMAGMHSDYYRKLYEEIDNPESVEQAVDYAAMEYTYYINQIKTLEVFSHFSEEQKDKLILLIKCGISGSFSVISEDLAGHPLPLEIYGEGYYESSKRGVRAKGFGSDTARSHHLGIVRGHMPIARDDEVLYPGDDFFRASEKATYRDNAEWVNENFRALVHPFSNSISGTALSILRNLAKFKQEGTLGDESIISSTENFNKFFKLFVAVLLFNAGGHSLNEFCYPLRLEAVQQEFSGLEGFSNLSLETLFMAGNEQAFDTALDRAIQYNQFILQKQALNTAINSRPPGQVQKELDQKVLAMNHSIRMQRDDKKKEMKQIKIKDALTDIASLVRANNSRVARQFLSQQRESGQKAKIIERFYNRIHESLIDGDLDTAIREASTLLETLEVNYGTQDHSCFSTQSKSYELAEIMVQNLSELKQDIAVSEIEIDLESEEAMRSGARILEAEYEQKIKERDYYPILVDREDEEMALISDDFKQNLSEGVRSIKTEKSEKREKEPERIVTTGAKERKILQEMRTKRQEEEVVLSTEQKQQRGPGKS